MFIPFEEQHKIPISAIFICPCGIKCVFCVCLGVAHYSQLALYVFGKGELCAPRGTIHTGSSAASASEAKSEIEPSSEIGKLAKAEAAEAARGGRAPKAGSDKELVNALFRANGSVRAASLGALCGKGPLSLFLSIHLHIDIDMNEKEDDDYDERKKKRERVVLYAGYKWATLAGICINKAAVEAFSVMLRDKFRKWLY